MKIETARRLLLSIIIIAVGLLAFIAYVSLANLEDRHYLTYYEGQLDQKYTLILHVETDERGESLSASFGHYECPKYLYLSYLGPDPTGKQDFGSRTTHRAAFTCNNQLDPLDLTPTYPFDVPTGPLRVENATGPIFEQNTRFFPFDTREFGYYITIDRPIDLSGNDQISVELELAAPRLKYGLSFPNWETHLEYGYVERDFGTQTVPATLFYITLRRPLYQRILTVVLLAAALIFIIVLVFVREIGSFVEGALAILLGLWSFREILIPDSLTISESAFLDTSFLMLYVLLVLSPLFRFLVAPALNHTGGSAQHALLPPNTAPALVPPNAQTDLPPNTAFHGAPAASSRRNSFFVALITVVAAMAVFQLRRLLRRDSS